MANSRLSFLFNKYLQGQLTDTDAREWNLLLQDEDNQAELAALVDQTYKNLPEVELKDISDPEQMFQNIVRQGKTRALWPRIAAAASIIAILGVGGYYLSRPTEKHFTTASAIKHEILPGTNAATLTLANGQRILLTKNMSGQLAMQGKTRITMQNGGAVTYSANGSETAYNTLSTKRKQQFPIVLADGTEVMLDAESSITYPVAFNGAERKVKVTGQAYFKVAHNASQPFSVEVKGQTIRDIGTEFNINAYEDEPVVKTTLVEGLITVNDQPLKPGQAAETKDSKLQIKAGDIEEATAWKNNLFHFSGTDIKPLMRQLARWYDLDVSYEGNIPKFEFGGDMSRGVKASEVFQMLEKYGLKVSVENNRIIISPK